LIPGSCQWLTCAFRRALLRPPTPTVPRDISDRPSTLFPPPILSSRNPSCPLRL
jgi:hypothetical protein